MVSVTGKDTIFICPQISEKQTFQLQVNRPHPMCKHAPHGGLKVYKFMLKGVKVLILFAERSSYHECYYLETAGSNVTISYFNESPESNLLKSLACGFHSVFI